MTEEKKEEAKKIEGERTQKEEQKESQLQEKQPQPELKKEKTETSKEEGKSNNLQEEKPTEKSPPEEKVEGTGETNKKTKKKINKMNLDEINKRLSDVKEKMGNLTSKYAQALLARKEELISEQERE